MHARVPSQVAADRQMPPRRDRAHHPATTASPNGWLSRRRQRRRRNRSSAGADEDADAPTTALPGDVLSEIISRASSSAADVVRYATTCQHWGRVVATHGAAICRALPPHTRFLPDLALGFIYQGNGYARASQRRRRCDVAASSAQPCLVPSACASGLLVGRRLRLGHVDIAGLFDHARPVASRNGRVVLELRREARADGLILSVCNPMTGEVSVLPPLSGEDCLGYYACGILTGDDLDVPAPLGFFRVVLVYNRRRFTALRSCSFSSDAGGSRWGPEGRKPGAKISTRMLRLLGPAVVVRGVAYWPMHRAAFGVRLDGAPSEAMGVSSVTYRLPHFYPDDRVLGVSSDGRRLSYVSVSFKGSITFTIDAETLTDDGQVWEMAERISLPELGVTRTTALKLRWFNEKSGTVLFTIGNGGGCTSSGAYMWSLATGSLEKLADGVEWHARSNLCGYEMDRATHFASIAGRF